MTWTPDGREGDPRATGAGPRDGGSPRSHRRRSTHQAGYEARHSRPRPAQRSRPTSPRDAGPPPHPRDDHIQAEFSAAAGYSRGPEEWAAAGRRPPPRRADSAWTRIPLRAPDGPLSANLDPTGVGGQHRPRRYAEARYTDPVYVTAQYDDDRRTDDPRTAEPGRRAAARPDPPVTRIRRFAKDFGWRAYAIPVLTVGTFLCLMDVARGTSGDDTSTAASHQTQAVESTVAATSAAPSPPPSAAPTSTAPATYVEEGAGTLSVVPGSSEVYGSGPLRTFIVEVEDGIDQDGAAFAAEVEKTLADPRSWGAGGQFSFQRVDTPDDYDFKVALVSPAHVESLCPGYGTEGYTSCRYQDRAVINLARWVTAVPEYAGDLATYRPYVINHEVGHWFGHGHVPCPGPGLLAPVMQQQTLGLNGCAKNAWPYPNSPDDNPENPNA